MHIIQILIMMQELSHPSSLTRVKYLPRLFKVVPKAKLHGRCGSRLIKLQTQSIKAISIIWNL